MKIYCPVNRETKLHEAASSGQLEKIKELCRTHLHLINEDDDGVCTFIALSVVDAQD